MDLHPIDAAIVIVYMIFILSVGIYMERRAGKDMESYFLGGRKIPWYLLGMSGSSSGFDITGTMWMVSTFYLLGMRGTWEHAMWGFPYAGFLMAYKAKWAYRSGMLTSIEWLVFRFGDGKAGQAARFMTVVIALIGGVLMLGYAGTGVGKFLEQFLPFPKEWTVPIIFGFTGLYVILGGFYSVVYSDFFQTVLMSLACVYIAVIAYLQIDPVDFRAAVGNEWFSMAPVMELPQPIEKDGIAVSEYAQPFYLLLMLWVTKGILNLIGGAGGSSFQRLTAARDEAEACKIGLAWGVVHSLRWSLAIAFTAFGLYIFAQNGDIVDSESVLPMVINQVIPVGIKGLILAALIAAFMSTFDSTLNVTASFIVNDLVKPAWKGATQHQLVRAGYIATLAVIAIGILISRHTQSIAAIWNPINFALGATLLVPGLLAPYWWRISGSAFCFSGAITLPVAFCVNVFTDWHAVIYFPILALTSLISCLLGAYLLPPVPDATLMNFYRKVRPFGLWGHVRKMLRDSGDPAPPFKRDRYDIPAALVGTLLFICLYPAMMDIVLHNWPRFLILTVLIAACAAFLYTHWWKRLDMKD